MSEPKSIFDLEEMLKWHKTQPPVQHKIALFEDGASRIRTGKTVGLHTIPGASFVDAGRGYHPGHLLRIYARFLSFVFPEVSEVVQYTHPLYVRKDSLLDNVKTTSERAEAISDSAFVPSLLHIKDDNSVRIELFDFLHSGKEEEVKERFGSWNKYRDVENRMQAYALARECGLALVYSALFQNSGLRCFNPPDGDYQTADNLKEKFKNLLGETPGISRWSDAYLKHKGRNWDAGIKSGLAEELGELIATHVCGFVFSSQREEPEQRRPRAPLADRPELRKYVIDLLNLEPVRL